MSSPIIPRQTSGTPIPLIGGAQVLPTPTALPTAVYNAIPTNPSASDPNPQNADITAFMALASTPNNAFQYQLALLTTTAKTSLQGYLSQLLTLQAQSGSSFVPSLSTLEQRFVTAYTTNVLQSTSPSDFINAGITPTTADMTSQMGSAWAAFASTHASLFNSTIPNYLPILQAWRQFTATAVTMSAATTPVTTTTASGNTTTTALPSYEAYFNQINPELANRLDPSSSSGQTYFQVAMSEFYNQQVQSQGYFLPTAQYNNWVTSIQTARLAALNPTPYTYPPRATTVVLGSILILLGQMIGVLQKVAAAQANRLSLYTTWTRGYSDVLNQIPVFTATSADYLSQTRGSGAWSTLAKARQDVQGNFNAQLTQKVTSYQNNVTNDAKSLQSNVNQSADAYNQQASTATAILQTLSTILSSIFPG